MMKNHSLTRPFAWALAIVFLGVMCASKAAATPSQATRLAETTPAPAEEVYAQELSVALQPERTEHAATRTLDPSAVPPVKEPVCQNCSATQATTLNNALSTAMDLACDSYYTLANLADSDRSSDMRYQAWFGSYAAQRYDTVASSFARICHILANHEISFDCRGESNTCTDAGAYTSADSPDTISLCEGYWLLPPDGTRSQASIIIHEVSHFADVADTDDYAYWYNDCRNLASIDPDKAVKNADSYEYYAVNMPRR